MLFYFLFIPQAQFKHLPKKKKTLTNRGKARAMSGPRVAGMKSKPQEKPAEPPFRLSVPQKTNDL